MAVFSNKCLRKFKVFDNPAHADLFSPTACPECSDILTLKAFKNAINRKEAETKNLKFVPKLYRNPVMGLIDATVLAKERELKGRGLQNLKYSPEADKFMSLMKPLVHERIAR